MKIPKKIDDLLLDNPNGDGYIPKEDITKEQLEELKEINKEYNKLYETDLISFS